MKKIKILVMICLLLFCLTGCSVEKINNMKLPEISVTSENSLFPPSIYEYDEDGRNDTERIYKESKSKIKSAWNKFIANFY